MTNFPPMFHACKAYILSKYGWNTCSAFCRMSKGLGYVGLHFYSERIWQYLTADEMPSVFSLENPNIDALNCVDKFLDIFHKLNRL